MIRSRFWCLSVLGSILLHGGLSATQTEAETMQTSPTRAERERLAATLSAVRPEEKYYVYALCDRGVPFYIGKGEGLRLLAHESDAEQAELIREALEALAAERGPLPPDERTRLHAVLTGKLAQIRDSKRRGDFSSVIIKWGLTNREALMCESALINLLRHTEGRKIGPLTNLVNGHASDAEAASAAAVKTAARDIPAFLEACAVETRELSELKALGYQDAIALVRINRLYPRCIVNGSVDPERVKDCTRGAWVIGADRRRKIKYLFALYQSRVVGIYRVRRVSGSLKAEWQTSALADYPRFPENQRQLDRIIARYPSQEVADADLAARGETTAAELIAASDRETTLLYPKSREEWENARHRIYFSVDEEIPEDLRPFRNSLLLRRDEANRLRKLDAQRSVTYSLE